MPRISPSSLPSARRPDLRTLVQQALASRQALPAHGRRGRWEPLFLEVQPLIEAQWNSQRIVDFLVEKEQITEEEAKPALWALQRRRRQTSDSQTHEA
jgi:hypothetical protein